MNLTLFDDSDAALWRDDELAPMWRHQLAARLEPELAEWDPELLRELGRDPAVSARLGEMAGKILHADDSPRELLSALKRLGKLMGQDRGRGIPRPIGKLLYFAAISAALVRGERISELHQRQVKQGLSWAAGLSWIDSESSQLIRRALAAADSD